MVKFQTMNMHNYGYHSNHLYRNQCLLTVSDDWRCTSLLIHFEPSVSAVQDKQLSFQQRQKFYIHNVILYSDESKSNC